MPQFELRAVTKSFGAVEVLRGIDFSAETGEFVCLLGPSGCGKSTLLRCIAGLEQINSGEILIDGQSMANVAPSRRNLAMVFQSYALYPHLSARKNMAFGLNLQGMGRSEIEARVIKAARILHIEPLLDRRPRQLSGGQRQRVAIGRAIVRDPSIFLFDEPLSNLDAALRGQMRAELARLHRELGRTMLFVTHDQVEAMTLSSKVVVLNGGRVEQIGPPLELYHRPKNRFVANFIGSPQMNFLKATVVSGDDRGTRLDAVGRAIKIAALLPGQIALGEEVEIGIRPEHLKIASNSRDGWKVKVGLVELLGAETIAHLKTADGQMLQLRAEGSLALCDGETVTVTAEENLVHVFDRKGRAAARSGTGGTAKDAAKIVVLKKGGRK